MEVEVLKEERIDKYLAEELGISRSTVKKMIDEGFVLVNGKEVKASLILSEADELFVKDGFIKEASFEAEDIPINIVYEDDDLLVINKKSGMVVHPGNGNTSGTLVNALMHYTKNLSNKEAFRPGIVHRIDKDTSGLMLVAKNEDKPGMIGQIGTLLGASKVNIATMQVSRAEDSAMMFMTVDSNVNKATLDLLRGLEGIIKVDLVRL